MPRTSSARARRSWRRARLARFVPFGSPLLTLVDQVRERQAPVNEYRVDISSPRIGMEKIVDLYVAPVPELPGSVVVMFQERSMADKIDRQMTHRGAARSVTGLAAMLAHEIKNPLSGIRGAAQLLETGLSRRGPRADPADHRRDRPHRLAGRPHGGLFRRAADRALPGQHPCRARPREGDRQERFCQPHQDLRGLRPVAAAGLRQPRPAGAGLPQPGEERRRGDRRRSDAARSRCRPRSGPASASPLPAARTASRCRSNSACATTGRAFRRISCRSCSIRSSPPSRTAPGSAWRWSPRSSASMAASSNAIPRRAAPASAS